MLNAFALHQALSLRKDLDAVLQEYARLRRVHILIYQLISEILLFMRDQILAPLMGIKTMQMILSSIVSGIVGDPFKTLDLSETFLLEK